MRAPTRLAAGLALALATATSAADAPGSRSPWEGFGVGTWVIRKKTSKLDAPGMSMPEETEIRETLVRVTDEQHVVKREKKTESGWEEDGEQAHARKPVTLTADDGSPLKIETEDLGSEKVTVEGKAIDCKKTRTHVANTVTTTWTSKTQGVLKTEIDSDAGGGRTHDVRTVTAFAKKARLAGKDLVCREWTLFTKMERPGVPSGNPGDGTTAVELETDAVPGRRARMEITGKRGPVKAASLEEVVAFEAKKP